MTGDITSSTRIRVLIVSAWDPIRGNPSTYRLLADRLASHGVRYSAYALDGWGDKSDWSFCDEFIEGPSPTLARVLSSGGYDLLHCNAAVYGRPYGVETWVRRARFRGPTVLVPHLARRELIGRAHATRCVAYSEEAAEKLALDADGEVVVIPNAVDDEVFHPAAVPYPWEGEVCEADDFGSIRAALVRALEGPSGAEKDCARHFSWDRTAAALLDAYRKQDRRRARV